MKRRKGTPVDWWKNAAVKRPLVWLALLVLMLAEGVLL